MGSIGIESGKRVFYRAGIFSGFLGIREGVLVVRKMSALGVANFVRINLGRGYTVWIRGPFQSEFQEGAGLNQAVALFPNDYALSIVVPDDMEEVWDQRIGMRGYRIIENPEPHQIAPFGESWEPVIVPGCRDGSSIGDCGAHDVVEYARRLYAV